MYFRLICATQNVISSIFVFCLLTVYFLVMMCMYVQWEPNKRKGYRDVKIQRMHQRWAAEVAKNKDVSG